MWQEYIITVVTFVLTLSILPALRDPNARIPLQTSGLTTLGLFIKAVMFGSLGMLSPAIGAGFGCLMWGLLAYLRSGVREQLYGIDAATTESAVADYSVADD
ncbi:hypothetical protein [Haloarcula nitratireducens]|uniref:Uncharacterized protein n=1 Tax=Haloarcula nitratireducens TaxID=2487749 RepID=A0AAW4PCJ8_9EURY|nr:hypothetical protein [Halomicroarcula nitratireducens]MBX0295634.1 hypothetical protein [Halomicroarcula nitratireducens]